jgi:hypothetical protein
MNNEVDLTFGFSCSIVATGTPVFDEITPKVSPAWTTQNRRAVLGVVFVFVLVVATTLCVVAGTPTVVAVVEPPACNPDRMSSTAIVAASRNAAGAA